MNCWLTVHHPPEKRSKVKPQSQSGIWVPSRWAYKVEKMSAGDGVIIYETLDGPSRTLRFADGTIQRSEYERKGRSGIVAIGKIDRLCTEQPVTVAEQDDGKRIEWVQLAEVEILSRDGLIPRVELNEILGYHPNTPMLGGGGTRSIPLAAYRQIALRFGLPEKA